MNNREERKKTQQCTPTIKSSEPRQTTNAGPWNIPPKYKGERSLEKKKSFNKIIISIIHEHIRTYYDNASETYLTSIKQHFLSYNKIMIQFSGQ